MVEAEHILREELGKFRLWQQSLGAIPTIARLQEKAETLRLEEMNKVSCWLAGGTVVARNRGGVRGWEKGY